MADTSILSDFGINILEEEIDDVIFQTNEFLCDATFTGSQGSFWWLTGGCLKLRYFQRLSILKTNYLQNLVPKLEVLAGQKWDKTC